MDWIITFEGQSSWPFCSNEKQWNFQTYPEWFLKEKKNQAVFNICQISGFYGTYNNLTEINILYMFS